jgi:hypothetical protein
LRDYSAALARYYEKMVLGTSLFGENPAHLSH